MLTEPDDLADLSPAQALNAVIADIDAHPIQPGGSTGLFTATRHIDLLSHLARRLAGDAYYYAEQAEHRPADAQRMAGLLATACRPVTQALQHYVQALAPLGDLRTPPDEADTAAVVKAEGLRRTVDSHLRQARTALDLTGEVLTTSDGAAKAARPHPGHTPGSAPPAPGGKPPRRTR
ncbi:hypothetical protein G4Z16_00960 [Streptomyces bathyalis]|uniref:Uncharacterized protein n=1 Tax=Streptomyces bathyalis TaxID=2710756 RepID=A0A7T1T2H7_9ACTN|nr:hypothetical protein [Streptomyces bathyalis]QPP05191.1 hypothetical protein G4Z16_00960 [Streptomyces bathyalis]